MEIRRGDGKENNIVTVSNNNIKSYVEIVKKEIDRISGYAQQINQNSAKVESCLDLCNKIKSGLSEEVRTIVSEHMDDLENPHEVSCEQVGAYSTDEVDNKLDVKADKSELPTKVSELQNDSGYLTAHQSLTGYATEDWVESKNYLTAHQDISGKADKTEIPTKVSQLQNDTGYLTAHQDISGLATKTEVSLKQDTISDLETIREGAELGATALQSFTETDPVYTADKPNIALKSEIPTKVSQLQNDSGYLTEHQDISGKADKTEIPTKVSQLANDKDYLTSVPEEYVTDTELNAKGYLTEVPSEYVTETELNSKGYLTEHQDISVLATKTEVSLKQDAISDLETIREGAELGATALQSFTETDPVYTADKPNIALKSEIPTKVSQLQNDSGYLTEHQDISGLAEKSEIPDISNLAAKNEIPDISGLATKTELNSKQDKSTAVTHTANTAVGSSTYPVYINAEGEATMCNFPTNSLSTAAITDTKIFLAGGSSQGTYVTGRSNVNNFIDTDNTLNTVTAPAGDNSTKVATTEFVKNAVDNITIPDIPDIPDISNLATKSEIPTKVSELENDSGYLTAHQDISGKADKTEIPTNVSELNNDSDYASKSYVDNKASDMVTIDTIQDVSGIKYFSNGLAAGTKQVGVVVNEYGMYSIKSNQEHYDEINIIDGISLSTDKNIKFTAGNKVAVLRDGKSNEVLDSGNYSNYIKNVSQLENDIGYLTSIPAEYVTETELNAKGYLTTHQDVSNLATKQELATLQNSVDNIGDISGIETSLANKANADLSNISDAGKKVIDGQWVSKIEVLSTAKAKGTYEIDLSTYLPNDNYNYEVLFYCNAGLGVGDPKTGNINIYGGVIPDTEPIKVRCYRVPAMAGNQSISFTMPVMSASKQITYDITSSVSDSTFIAYMYRRIGTNN